MKILQLHFYNQNQTCECKQCQDETHDEDEEMRLWRNLITSGLLICVLVIVVTVVAAFYHKRVQRRHMKSAESNHDQQQRSDDVQYAEVELSSSGRQVRCSNPSSTYASIQHQTRKS
ncbi:hypothetical protein P4O66_022056 [Electrophorus voltai]|uniref:Uncharacterized protein n=1 Tax=Electrophorus voltai TaxID=2609070 RepID=A0AAD9E0D0_9TELE|nr:hypothetical protein P4O66_022056 [Electrophorus voltai]